MDMKYVLIYLQFRLRHLIMRSLLITIKKGLECCSSVSAHIVSD